MQVKSCGLYIRLQTLETETTSLFLYFPPSSLDLLCFFFFLTLPSRVNLINGGFLSRKDTCFIDKLTIFFNLHSTMQRITSLFKFWHTNVLSGPEIKIRKQPFGSVLPLGKRNIRISTNKKIHACAQLVTCLYIYVYIRPRVYIHTYMDYGAPCLKVRTLSSYLAGILLLTQSDSSLPWRISETYPVA